MRDSKWKFLACVVLLVMSGVFAAPFLASQKSVMKTSDQFILYSLVPDPVGNDEIERFHKFPVLGKVEIKDAKIKAELVDTLYEGIANANATASCHNPRHAIHAVKGRRTVEATICFECNNIFLFEGRRKGLIPLSSAPEKLFNRTLRAAGIPLSGK